MIKEAISKLIDGVDLSRSEARDVMKEIMSGNATQAQIGAFLTALRLKGETVDEITACAEIMREFANRIKPKAEKLIDTCGTGGDEIKTFNISTATAFVVAGCGLAVAKHGNRSVTSKCGSADVLEALGLKIDLTPKEVEECINKCGIGFLFAPKFHPAMKYAIGPRREMGIRTIFNILGPLTNPAFAAHQIMGVFDPTLTETLAKVLANLGAKHALVVHGIDGLDEVSTIGKTRISEAYEGNLNTYEVTAKDFGLKQGMKEGILASISVEKNVEDLFKILKGQKGPKADIVLANSSVALKAGLNTDFQKGVELATESIESGKAYEKLKLLIKESSGDMSKLEKLEDTL
ncbi:MAG: anthranilate phosphoribosyltransferase [Candidatus Helarchaeota archaeon]|nr:anthranilate phosphoribosyltransferase [Candidatus Helarchaeota archaeon]